MTARVRISAIQVRITAIQRGPMEVAGWLGQRERQLPGSPKWRHQERLTMRISELDRRPAQWVETGRLPNTPIRVRWNSPNQS